MIRRPATPSPHTVRVSGDRWLFGYADIVTLLLACFASLYATGLAPAAAPEPEPPPAAVETDTEIDATSTVTEPPVVAELVPEPPPPPSALELALEHVVGDAVSLPGVEVMTSTRGLVISLPEAGSFAPGRADLSASARAVMLDLADRLRDLPNQIRVEGHTDDVPIATAQFASNWDLSTARATRVVAFLIDDGRIDPERLAAAGYAEYRPRLPNDTPEARSRNRRVDIVVLDPGTAEREDPNAASIDDIDSGVVDAVPSTPDRSSSPGV